MARTGRFVIATAMRSPRRHRPRSDCRTIIPSAGQVILRNNKWEKHDLPGGRSEKYRQKAALIHLTGWRTRAKSRSPRSWNACFSSDGKDRHFWESAISLRRRRRYQATTNNRREEHFRRLAEVSNINRRGARC
jgi:hypothetical protein